MDYRLTTFLTLCETMNYRVTAERLNMTQPAVTQHIHYLEEEYGCKLFSYNGKSLQKKEQAVLLERYARALLYREKEFLDSLRENPARNLRFGATKTIGEFIIEPYVRAYLQPPENHLTLTVDNTEILLRMLDHNELDFAMIEGYFNKSHYGYRLFRREPFVGMCAVGHPFAGREVAMEEVFSETLLIREHGSGTRAVLEQVLHDHNYTVSRFSKVICINHFGLISRLVADGAGITFVYRAVAEGNPDLATFTLRDCPVLREFNYVYLRGTDADTKIALLEGAGEEKVKNPEKN